MIVKGIANWAKVYPNHYDSHPKYGDKWTINLTVSDEDAKILLDNGLATACIYGTDEKPEPNADGAWEFRFKRKLKIKDGTVSKEPPTVCDAKRSPFNKPIGNGSKVVVQYTTYSFEGKVYNDLQGVQVLELVTFGGGLPDGAEFEAQVDDTTEFVEQGGEEDNPFA